jgi:hypothetical protein
MSATNPAVPLEELYRTSVLLESFAEVPSARTFLRDRLFSRTQETEADMVEIEFYRGARSSDHFAAGIQKERASRARRPGSRCSRHHF